VCTEVDSCEKCLSLPACGWCDDGSGIGLGKCVDGSNRGPLTANATGIHLNQSVCSADLWHFTDCPGMLILSFLAPCCPDFHQLVVYGLELMKIRFVSGFDTQDSWFLCLL